MKEKEEIIKRNLFGLYEYIGQNCNVSFENNDEFQCINNSPWPRFIYNEIICKVNQKEFLERINKGIANKTFPSFLITTNDSFLSNNEECLTSNTFKRIMQWPGMLVSIDDLHKNVTSNLEIIQVSSIEDIEIWNKMVSSNLFNKSTFNLDFLLRLLDLNRIKLYLGLTNEKYVSTVMTYSNDDTVGLFMGSTLKEYRGQGFGRDIIVKSALMSSDEKTKYIVLEANNASQKIYESIGFKEYCKFDIFWKLGYE